MDNRLWRRVRDLQNHRQSGSTAIRKHTAVAWLTDSSSAACTERIGNLTCHRGEQCAFEEYVVDSPWHSAISNWNQAVAVGAYYITFSFWHTVINDRNRLTIILLQYSDWDTNNIRRGNNAVMAIVIRECLDRAIWKVLEEQTNNACRYSP